MKNIKEYIINYFNESLFDTEDDLLDKRPTAEALKWFLDPKNVIGLWGTYNQKSSNYFKINDKGEIYLDKLFGNIIRLFKPIPSWINLDKKVWNSDTFFNIEYPIKSQKDIPSQGVIRQIENNKALHNLSLNISSRYVTRYIFKAYDITSIKNLNIKFLPDTHGPNIITFVNSKLDFKDLSEIYLKDPNITLEIFFINDNGINDNGPMFKFLKDVYKQISKDKSSVEITEHTEEFKKMYDNGVRFFYINARGCLYLIEYMGKIYIDYQKGPAATKAQFRSVKDLV